MKRFLVGGMAAAALVFSFALAPGGPAHANHDDKPGQKVCPDLGSGHKVPPTEDSTFLLKADPGFLITEYCVKAGSDQSVVDGAVVYVDLRLLPSGPLAEVLLEGPGGKDISHYSFSQAEPEPETPEPEPETPEPEPETPTPEPETPAAAPPQTEVAAAGPVPPAGAPAAAPPAPAQSALPSTGSSSWGLALTALASLLGGLGLVKLSRRTTS